MYGIFPHEFSKDNVIYNSSDDRISMHTLFVNNNYNKTRLYDNQKSNNDFVNDNISSVKSENKKTADSCYGLFFFFYFLLIFLLR
jgi:hypothetical protein